MPRRHPLCMFCGGGLRRRPPERVRTADANLNSATCRHSWGGLAGKPEVGFHMPCMTAAEREGTALFWQLRRLLQDEFKPGARKPSVTEVEHLLELVDRAGPGRLVRGAGRPGRVLDIAGVRP